MASTQEGSTSPSNAGIANTATVKTTSDTNEMDTVNYWVDLVRSNLTKTVHHG